MARDILLKLTGIDGDSGVKDHEGEIDVESWSWGATQSGTMHFGKGKGEGKVSIQDVSVTKKADIASPTLWFYCSKGKKIDEAVLTVRGTIADEPTDVMVLTMNDVIIRSVSTGSDNGEGDVQESLTLNFAAAELAFTGPEGDTKTYSWDVVANDGSVS